MADVENNPAVLRRRLLITLQTARAEKEMTQAEAARHLGWSASKLLRIENGKHGVSSDDLGALLELYGITDPDKTRDLWSAAKGAAGGQRAGVTGRGITSEYRTYLTFETSASAIKQFEPVLIPGHLQTPEYAYTVVRGLSDPSDSEESVRERVALRLHNQEILTREPPPTVHFLLDEAVIQRRVGGPAVMVPQLRHLQELSHRPNVTIQIVPFDLGVHAGLGGPFILLEFDRGDESPVLYRENSATDQLHHKDPEEIQKYLTTFAQLAATAAPATWIDRIIDDAVAAMTPFRAPSAPDSQ